MLLAMVAVVVFALVLALVGCAAWLKVARTKREILEVLELPEDEEVTRRFARRSIRAALPVDP